MTAPRVKPLVWQNDMLFCGQPHAYADMPLGPWTVTAYDRRGGKWAYDDPSGDTSDMDWPTREEAQAAAEADYETRILAALEPQDAPTMAEELVALRSQNDALMRERTSMIATHRGNLALAEKRHAAELAALRARVAEMEAALTRIDDWAQAYPEEAFPEPDLTICKTALKSAGQSIDGLHASWARHILNGIGGITRAALTAALSPAPQAQAASGPNCDCFGDTGLQASTYVASDGTERCDLCGKPTKPAAQADHEARILAALEPQDAPAMAEELLALRAENARLREDRLAAFDTCIKEAADLRNTQYPGQLSWWSCNELLGRFHAARGKIARAALTPPAKEGQADG